MTTDSLNRGFRGWLLAVTVAVSALALAQFLTTLAYMPAVSRNLIANPLLALRLVPHAVLVALLCSGIALLVMRFKLARPLLIGWAAATLAVSVGAALVDGRFNLACIWPLAPLLYFIQSQQLRATLDR